MKSPIFGGHFGCHLVYVVSAILAAIFVVDGGHFGFVVGSHLGSHIGSDGSHLGCNPSAILDPNSKLPVD